MNLNPYNDTISHYFCQYRATTLMTGENEWTKSTNDQVARLTNLINSLVALSRLEEQPDIVLQDVDFSYITEDAAEGL